MRWCSDVIGKPRTNLRISSKPRENEQSSLQHVAFSQCFSLADDAFLFRVDFSKRIGKTLQIRRHHSERPVNIEHRFQRAWRPFTGSQRHAVFGWTQRRELYEMSVFPDQLLQLMPVSGVSHVGRCQAASTRLFDTITHVIQSRRSMCVRVDHNRDAVRFRGQQMDVVEIESNWIGIEFQQFPVFLGGLHYRFHVHVVGFAFVEQSTGWMRDQTDVRIANRGQRCDP